jgi:MHS family shikimate/dehydroshikimate transporter-like MFS transporter
VISTDRVSAAAARPRLRTVALGSMIGTTIEWYDFYLYATASALVFKPLFFPNISSTAGTLGTFATYAAGFGARPVISGTGWGARPFWWVRW